MGAHRLEGVDRRAELPGSGVEYQPIAKPERTELSREELLADYVKLTGFRRRCRTEEAFTELAEAELAKHATVVTQESYFLWNQEKGDVYFKEYAVGSLAEALPQREAGYRRFLGSSVQRKPGFAMTWEGLHRYRVRTHLLEDYQFTQQADYLAAEDQLSRPFETGERHNSTLANLVLERVASGTTQHRGFESLILGRPRQHSSYIERILPFGWSGPVDAPNELNLATPLDDSRATEPADETIRLLCGIPEDKPKTPHLDLVNYRGRIDSIPELAGREWAALQVGNEIDNEQAFMEEVAASIGNGSRVYVEGGQGTVRVLVPVQFGFCS